MSATDLIEYKGFIIIITSSEESTDAWQGSYHISVNGKIYKEKALRPLRTAKDAAEDDALSAAKEIVDEISDGKYTLVEYRDHIIKQVVGPVKDGANGPRWYATVVVDTSDRSTSTGFIDAEPAYSVREAALNGVLAGQHAIDRKIVG